jgi:hypothetical protein
LNVPGGFIDANLVTLAGSLVLIAVGLVTLTRREDGRPRVVLDAPVASLGLLIWLTVPPLLLLADSRLARPILGVGHDRSELFVAPAYLILVARGIARLPIWAGWLVGIAISARAMMMLATVVFAPDLTADWRTAAAALDRADPSKKELVFVVAADPAHNGEVEAARHYLRGRRVYALPISPAQVWSLRRSTRSRFWIAVGVRDGQFTASLPYPLPIDRNAPILDVNGLRIIASEAGTLP